MAIGGVNLGQELLNVPMGDMIRSIALAIADAQWALDKSSMVVTELMSGQRLLRDLETGELMDAAGRRTGTPTVVDSRIYFGYVFDDDGNRVPTKMSMMELGFVPTFYQFVDTVIEVKLALRINQVAAPIDPATGDAMAVPPGGWAGDASRRTGVTVTSTPVDAGYAAAYNFSLEMASVFRTKLVPVPPPAVLEERLRELVRQGDLAEQRNAP